MIPLVQLVVSLFLICGVGCSGLLLLSWYKLEDYLLSKAMLVGAALSFNIAFLFFILGKSASSLLTLFALGFAIFSLGSLLFFFSFSLVCLKRREEVRKE